MRGKLKMAGGRGQRQTVQHLNVTFFVSGLQVCSVKAMLRMSKRACKVRGETGHVRGKGAKGNCETLECDIFRFGALRLAL